MIIARFLKLLHIKIIMWLCRKDIALHVKDWLVKIKFITSIKYIKNERHLPILIQSLYMKVFLLVYFVCPFTT